jgi:hypothetical protein
MGWFLAYLISVIVVPAVFAMFYCDHADNEVKINNVDSVLSILGFSIAWPITITMIVFDLSRTKYKTYFINKGRDLLRNYNLERISVHDRTDMISIPEEHLKFLLKNYRKKRITLDRKVVELIRDELMNRTAERSLFK